MTFSLSKVLTLMLAIAQIESPQTEVRPSYNPSNAIEMAADMSRGCRAMFSDPKFFTAAEMDSIVLEFRKELEAQLAAQNEASNPAAEPSPVPSPQTTEAATAAALPPETNKSSPEAPVASDISDISDVSDVEEVADVRDKPATTPAHPGAGSENSTAGSALPTNANMAEVLGGLKLFKDLSLNQALDLWDGICREQQDLSKVSFIDWNEVAKLYNDSVATLPDHRVLKGYRLPEASYIYDSNGNLVKELYQSEGRRSWLPLKEIPLHVQQAFISAEDKSFRQHKGVEPKGVLRGFLKFLKSKKIEGGSTITQQVIKNILVGPDVSLDRKIKEMLLAKRVENSLSKDEILELYLNLINLGRHSWGVEMAARNYFGKQAKDLVVSESAFLAGVTHSPNRYEPSKGMEAVLSRRAFVIDRMVEDGYIKPEEKEALTRSNIEFLPPRRLPGTSFFVSALTENLRENLTPTRVKAGGLKVRSTMNRDLQRATELAMQEGLFEFESNSGRLGVVRPISEIPDPLTQGWADRLSQIKAQYSDIGWELVVVLGVSEKAMTVGLPDGSQVDIPFNPKKGSKGYVAQWARTNMREREVGDVVFVHGNRETGYQLRVEPMVEGSIVAMDIRSGRVLSLVGGFSATYSNSKSLSDAYNRAISAYRQPGSTLKPFTYLAALQQGLQPNLVLRNEPAYFPRIAQKCRAWNPKNYKSGGESHLTMRRGLETSNNRITAQLLMDLVPEDFMAGLDLVRNITRDFGLYEDPYHCVSFILGSDETTLLRLVTAYSMIANGGYRITPKFVDSMQTVRGENLSLPPAVQGRVLTVDDISLTQIKSLLNGTLLRGTAQRIADLAPYVAGKTGTSNDENDAWFIGFTEDIAIGVWVGYDSRKVYANLGSQGTGGRAAVPIFEKVLRASFETFKQPRPLQMSHPSTDVRVVDVYSGVILSQGPGENLSKGKINEIFRPGFYTQPAWTPEISGEITEDAEVESQPELTEDPIFDFDVQAPATKSRNKKASASEDNSTGNTKAKTPWASIRDGLNRMTKDDPEDYPETPPKAPSQEETKTQKKKKKKSFLKDLFD